MNELYTQIREKNLYVDGTSREVFVDIHGNAIRFSPKFNKDEERLYSFLCPLKKILRISCTGHVIWDSSAIIECSKHNISIVIMHNKKAISYISPKFIADNRISETLMLLNADIKFLKMIKIWQEEIENNFNKEILSKLSAIKIPKDETENIKYENILYGFFESWLHSELIKKSLNPMFLGINNCSLNLLVVFSKIMRRFLIPLSYKIAIYLHKPANLLLTHAEKAKICCMMFDTHEKLFKTKFHSCWISFVLMTYQYFEEVQNAMGYHIRYNKPEKVEKNL